MAEVLHLATHTWSIWCYYEWIESKSNWSDEISREGLQGTFHQEHNFSPGMCECCWRIFSLPTKAIVTIFKYIA